MATFRTSAAGGSTTGTGDRTVAITPAVGDLLVVYCFVSTNTNDSPTCSDNNAVASSWTRIDVANVVISSVNHRLSVFVRDDLAVNTNATTITVATGSNTSGAVHCIAVSGMGRTGSNAVRSKGLQNNQAAGTAAPALNQNALTANLTIAAQGSADTTTTPPTNWTERQDTNFSNPTIALETATRDGGFTGTTITFGAASSTTFCSHALELDGTAALVGSADLAFGGGSSTLTGSGALAGSAALVLDSTATGAANSPITGTATLTTAATGTFYHPYTQLSTFAYTIRRYGSFYKPPGRMFGPATVTLTASGTVDQEMPIAGTADLTFTGKLLHPRWTTQLLPHMWPGRRYGSFARPAGSSVAGSADLTLTGSALIVGSVPIAGTTDLVAGGAGALTGTGALLGTTTILVTGTGLLDLPSGQMIGTAALTIGTVAALAGTGALNSSAPLVFGGAGTALAIGHLAGSGDLICAAAGLLNLPGGQIVAAASLLISGSGTASGGILYLLYGYYRLDGDLNDSSGHARHLGATIPGPVFTDGVLNQGLDQFGGVYPGPIGLSGPVASTPFTLANWIRQNTDFAIIDELGWTTGAGVAFNHSNPGGLTADWSFSVVGVGTIASGTFPADVWTHFAATFDGVTLVVYVNANPVYTGTPNLTAGGLWSNAGNFEVIANTNHDHDEVAFYGRSLDAGEIADLFNDGAGFDPTSVDIIGEIFERPFWSWARQYKRPFWSWARVAEWRAGMPSQIEPSQLVMTISESRVWGFDFSDAPEIANGNTIIDPLASGAFVPSSIAGLSLGAVSVTVADFDDIPATGGLQAQITASAEGTYEFAMKATTTTGSVLIIPCELVVVADHG